MHPFGVCFLNRLTVDIQFDKISPNHGIISITLQESDYKPVVEKQIRHYAQNVRLKGFRLGAAPVDLVKKMYGRSILTEELNKIAAAALKNYIDQERIPIFIEPLLVAVPPEIDLENQHEFTFSYEVGLMEERSVELGPHMSVTAFEIDHVDHKLVDEFLEGLQIVHGQSVDLKESDQDAMLYGSLEDSTGAVQLALRMAVERVPEHLRETLVGLHAGCKVMLTEEMLGNHFPALSGISFDAFTDLKMNKAAWPCSFTINRIARVTPAPIEPALFNLVLGEGVVDSESAFREAIAKVILFDKRMEARYACDEAIREELFKHNVVSLPDAFLKKWLLVNNPEVTLQGIENYYLAYEQDLRWEILLGSIVSQNNLAVTQSDVVNEAKRIYFNHHKNNLSDVALEPNDDNIHAALIAFLQENGRKHYLKLHEQLSRDRAINFIKQHISVDLKTVTAAQFDARKIIS